MRLGFAPPSRAGAALLDHLHRCSAVLGKALEVGSLQKRPCDKRVSRHVELPPPDPKAAKTPKPDTFSTRRRLVVVPLLASATKCSSSAYLPGSGRRILSHRNEVFAALASEDRRPMGASESREWNPPSWARSLSPSSRLRQIEMMPRFIRCHSIAAQRLRRGARQSKREKTTMAPVGLVPREPRQDGVALIFVKRIGFGAMCSVVTFAALGLTSTRRLGSV